MKLLLQRFSDNRDCTLGLLFKVTDKPVFLCYTLEDEARDIKVSKETRIPEGVYKLGIRKEDTPLTLKYRSRYAWFRYHIEVLNVPNFKGIYIHIGNDDSHTDGCILLGDGADNNQIHAGTINSSTQAFRRFYGIVYDILSMTKEEVTLEIRNENKLL